MSFYKLHEVLTASIVEWFAIPSSTGSHFARTLHYDSSISGGPTLFSSVAQSCPTLATPWTAARQASLSITNSQSWLKLMSIESVMPSNHLILCYPLLLLPSIFPSIRVFSNESALHIRWFRIPIPFRISHSLLWSTVKGFGIVKLVARWEWATVSSKFPLS